MANSGSTWGWCLLEGIKNFRLAFSGRLISASSIGLAFFPWMIFFWSEIRLATIKTMDLSSTSFLPTQSYRSNIFFFIRVHLDWQTHLQHFILLKAGNLIYFYSLFLHGLRLNIWAHMILYLIYCLLGLNYPTDFIL